MVFELRTSNLKACSQLHFVHKERMNVVAYVIHLLTVYSHWLSGYHLLICSRSSKVECVTYIIIIIIYFVKEQQLLTIKWNKQEKSLQSNKGAQ